MGEPAEEIRAQEPVRTDAEINPEGDPVRARRDHNFYRMATVMRADRVIEQLDALLNGGVSPKSAETLTAALEAHTEALNKNTRVQAMLLQHLTGAANAEPTPEPVATG
jgi:hypothetical protein